MTFLHESMEPVIDYLQTYQNLICQDVHNKLPDITTRREANATTEAFNARSSDEKSSQEALKDASKEWSFWKKNGDVYQGHLTCDCRKRRNAKKEAIANVAEISGTC